MTDLDLHQAFNRLARDVQSVVGSGDEAKVRRKVRRQRLITVSACSAVVAGVLVVLLTGAGIDVSRGPVGPSGPVTQRTNGAPDPTAVRLQGEWRTAPITRADVTAMLDAAGLHRYARAYATHLPTHPFRLRLTMVGDVIRVWQGATLVSTETFTVGPSQLTTQSLGLPGETDTAHYAWSVTGDRLRLTFLDTDAQPYNGYPAQVTLRALYTAAAFIRLD